MGWRSGGAAAAGALKQKAVREIGDTEAELTRGRSAARASQIIDYLFYLAYGIIGLAIALEAIGARESAGFKQFIDTLVTPLVTPFRGIMPDPGVGSFQLMLSYVVAHRAKEIGVRMTLGATTGSVAGLVLSHTSRSVGLGLVAGGGLAAALATVLMATPAAEELGGLVRVFDPVAYVAGTLIIAAACLVAASVPTLRAARIDPIATLRED